MQRAVRLVLALLMTGIVAGCTPVSEWIPSGGQGPGSPTVVSNHDGSGSASVTPSGSGSGQVPSTNQTGSPTPMPPAPAPKPAPQYPVLSLGRSGPNVTRLQQLLAKLGYLPVTWTPQSADSNDDEAQFAYLDNPPAGSWQWRYPSSTPAVVRSLWQPGNYNVLTKGAIMTFQQANGLTIDGAAGPDVWRKLLKDVANGATNPYGYTFVHVKLNQPQSLTVWWNGKTVLTTAVNSGIKQSPTVTGTYPVFVQYRTQRMSGVDPWGNHYDDPGVPYVSYFYKGEAVHGFTRAAYGYPQSLGCVELPVQNAAISWKYMHYGTLVNVSDH